MDIQKHAQAKKISQVSVKIDFFKDEVSAGNGITLLSNKVIHRVFWVHFPLEDDNVTK